VGAFSENHNIMPLDSSIKTITIRSRLCDTVKFPSYGEKLKININESGLGALKGEQTPSDLKADSFYQFSEMYQWLKVIVNEADIIEENVNIFFKK
jgi:hypothetical protein